MEPRVLRPVHQRPRRLPPVKARVPYHLQHWVQQVRRTLLPQGGVQCFQVEFEQEQVPVRLPNVENVNEEPVDRENHDVEGPKVRKLVDKEAVRKQVVVRKE